MEVWLIPLSGLLTWRWQQQVVAKRQTINTTRYLITQKVQLIIQTTKKDWNLHWHECLSLFEFCLLSGRRRCDEPITRLEKSYRLCCVIMRDLETSKKKVAMARFWAIASEREKERCKFCKLKCILLPLVQQPNTGQGRLIVEIFTSPIFTHPQPVGFLRTGDWPDVGTCTWQHPTLTTDRLPCLRRNSNPQPQHIIYCRPLDPSATWIGIH
jgi:hypothetical protein